MERKEQASPIIPLDQQPLSKFTMKMELLVNDCFQVLWKDLITRNFLQSDFGPDGIQRIESLLPHGFLSKAEAAIGFTSASEGEYPYLFIFPLEHGRSRDHSQWKTSPLPCVIMFSRSQPSEAVVYGYHTLHLHSPISRGFTTGAIPDQAKPMFEPGSKAVSPTAAFKAISHLLDVMREEINENAGHLKFH
jgi:hypothetical protein